MAGFVLRGSILESGSILRKILIVVGTGLSCAWVQAPAASAQHVPVRTGAHVGGSAHIGGGTHVGAPRITAPPPSRAAVPRGRIYVGPRPVGVGSFGFRFRQRPIFRVRRPVFFAAPYVGVGLGFDSFGWPACGPAWDWGFGCTSAPFYGFGFENYVAVQPYENAAYLLGQEDRELVWLFLKDGTVRSVTDYWFVNGQVHFSTIADAGPKSEQVIGEDELDLQRTIDVNTRRGFRIVQRDAPWQQYLRDHPDQTPPALQ
jgi:hypothetical protein